MNFNKHLEYEGKHAFLGASGYHWLNYTEEKMRATWLKHRAKERGTELHALAAQCIKLGVALPKVESTLSQYVNDAIFYRMTPEQVLVYSDNAFGTADTISFDGQLLRIHDLKTGDSAKASFKQLLIYAGLFCLEYNVDPTEISVELRIYQMNEVRTYIPTTDELIWVISRIVEGDEQIETVKKEALLNGFDDE